MSKNNRVQRLAIQHSTDLLHKVHKKIPLTPVEKYELHGYTCIHLFRDFWLVRNISIFRRRFSFYRLKRIDNRLK